MHLNQHVFGGRRTNPISSLQTTVSTARRENAPPCLLVLDSLYYLHNNGGWTKYEHSFCLASKLHYFELFIKINQSRTENLFHNKCSCILGRGSHVEGEGVLPSTAPAGSWLPAAPGASLCWWHRSRRCRWSQPPSARGGTCPCPRRTAAGA